METIEAYLKRKHQELKLLNDCLKNPLALPRPQSVAEVVRHKFQLTAALRAEHALHDWAITETAWAHAGDRASGPFTFSYDYQRADLEVRGPSFYGLDHALTRDTVYAASGMAAIAALLLASARVIGEANILVLPGSYGETIELIQGYARHLRLLTLKGRLQEEAGEPTGLPRVMLFDSCAPAAGFEAVLRCASPALDLLIFDTTCFSSGSGRIRRVLRWARKSRIPVVLVRSHTKLDSLGAEYGRLGSAVFVDADTKNDPRAGRSKMKELSSEMRNAVRLLGGAALPAHFPPYIGSSSYRALTNKRVAAILRNGRRTARYFASALAGRTAELHFTHGLYVTLGSPRQFDEQTARQVAAEMSDDLRRAGFPIRHAGSFGFDFAATEWFHDSTTGRYSVRIAVADLPTALWDDLTEAVARWWVASELRRCETAA